MSLLPFGHSVMSDLFATPWTVSPPGSAVHGIFQARTLEWVVISFPGDLPHPGIEPAFPEWQADFFFFYHLSHQGSP